MSSHQLRIDICISTVYLQPFFIYPDTTRIAALEANVLSSGNNRMPNHTLTQVIAHQRVMMVFTVSVSEATSNVSNEFWQK